MKFSDLQIGMVIKNDTHAPVLITNINNNSKFFGEDNHITFLDVEDAYSGQASRSVADNETWELVTGEGRLKALTLMAKHLLSTTKHMQECIDLVQKAAE